MDLQTFQTAVNITSEELAGAPYLEGSNQPGSVYSQAVVISASAACVDARYTVVECITCVVVIQGRCVFRLCGHAADPYLRILSHTVHRHASL